MLVLCFCKGFEVVETESHNRVFEAFNIEIVLEVRDSLNKSVEFPSVTLRERLEFSYAKSGSVLLDGIAISEFEGTKARSSSLDNL